VTAEAIAAGAQLLKHPKEVFEEVDGNSYLELT